MTYTARSAGDYRLDVGLAPNVGPIAGSPFYITVRPAPADPRATTLVAPPPQTVLCGRPFMLQLIARDRWGNLCTSSVAEGATGGGGGGGGGEDVGDLPNGWVTPEGSRSRASATVHRLEPGKYGLSFTPVTQGKNTVHVCWASMNVKGSPFLVRALPGTRRPRARRASSRARLLSRLAPHDSSSSPAPPSARAPVPPPSIPRLTLHPPSTPSRLRMPPLALSAQPHRTRRPTS